jgi:hypothetical protein
MDRNAARDRIPIAEALALKAWHTENQPWVPYERVSDGYIAQEIEKRRLKRHGS